MSKWMLPEYVSDVLPSEARKIEEMRRYILDKFRSFGYELVMPPLLEYLDSLLTGTGQDLDTQTFKLLDMNSGKTMGIRADITPQIARIDAHLLNRHGITRLCYAGETLHTKPQNNQETRTPLQIGAEIYGTNHIQADIEIAQLMCQSLSIAGVKEFIFSIGHAGFIEVLNIDIHSPLFNAILAKDSHSIIDSNHQYKDVIIQLLNIHTINELNALAVQYPILSTLIQDTRAIYNTLTSSLDLDNLENNVYNILIDITDIEGYYYHTGLTYNVYHKHSHSPIAKGGRYDKVSSAFGRLRLACGFSINLRQISQISCLTANPDAILAPWITDDNLQELINQLRLGGKIVIQLEDNTHIDEFTFKQKIIFDNKLKSWILI